MPLKVLCVVDKKGTALDRLAKGVEKYHDAIEYKVLDVHPKRPDERQLADFEREVMYADIIDWQYFRTAEMLRSRYDLSDKKHILTHNNHYSIEESDWNNYDLNVGNNDYITKRLKELTKTPVEYVPITIDLDFWKFNQNWLFDDLSNHAGKYERQGVTAKPTVIMVANRIESKKGILPVAIACGDLGVKFILVGAVSDPNYMQSIMETGNVEFYEQISDEKLRDLYCMSTVHVCNSIDNFESGTMPVLEAMACGVPVLARNVGHVPELNNGENMVIQPGSSEDVIGITEILKDMIFDKKKLKEMREKGWETVKRRNFERRAYMYQKLYRQVLSDQTPVSVVLPIYKRPEIIRKNLEALASQTYKNLEIVVADDNDESNQDIVDNFRLFVNFPVKYINTANHDYGLARARNEATIEATGEIIVYCDERMILEPDAIEKLVAKVKPKTWVYGNKGAKKEFVENFSAVYRQDVINAGLFSERINLWGGQSQEIRTRIRSQGFQIEFVEYAKATPTSKSSNKWQKRDEVVKMKNKLWMMGLE